MNEPYSPWHQRNPAGEQPLADRYTGSEPILWNGSMVYPMYTDRIGTEPILLYMTLLSQAPPAGLRGHGLGLSVLHGYIELDGHKLTGVDIWSDALARGVTVELVPTATDAVFSLTPVWVDQTGAHRSWTGNYGMLVEDIPNDIVALWCSLGEGPPNFANLVVGVGIAPVRPGTRESSRPAAAEPVDPPAPAEPIEAVAEPGEWVEHTAGALTETPAAAERTPSDSHADPSPADSPYPDSGYADDRLTETRVPKERQVRRGETRPPAQPAPAFVDENATMTMKYTLPPWGAVPTRPSAVDEQRATPGPESVWDALPGPAHSAESPVSSEPAAVTLAPESAQTWPSPPDGAAGSTQDRVTGDPTTSEPVYSPAPGSAFEQHAATDPLPETAPGPAFAPAQAADAADPGAAYRNALYELGTAMYDRGEQEQACGLWAQAAEAGHAQAAHDLAVLLFRGGDHTTAEGWWRVAAGYGEFRSMSLLAELLARRGESEEAAQWRTRAAEYAARAGHPLHS